MIVTSDGYILTNNHVVDDADEVSVTLTDKRQFTAAVIGTDKATDVAVLKIDASNLHAAKLGDLNDLQVGEWALAVGSPFGLDQTVTAGIISALVEPMWALPIMRISFKPMRRSILVTAAGRWLTCVVK